MQIARNSLDTQAGPSDWFTDSVYIDTVAAPSGASRLSASSVHFTPGARTAWHTTRTARHKCSIFGPAIRSSPARGCQARW
jgi:quercetin dioxygenase-like cupin family protein